MGLIINEFPVYDNLATIDSVYLNIKDIKLDKTGDGYEISFWFNISKGDKFIYGQQITKNQSEPHINNSWNEAYDIIKLYLDEKKLTYIDEI